jgi:hypothetical protein
VWEAAEPKDDVAVLVGMLQIASGEMSGTLGRRVAQLREQPYRRVLVHGGFRVFEREVQERSMIPGQSLIQPGFDGGPCYLERQWVGGKCQG